MKMRAVKRGATKLVVAAYSALGRPERVYITSGESHPSAPPFNKEGNL